MLVVAVWELGEVGEGGVPEEFGADDEAEGYLLGR